MRTTLSLDDDVTALIERARKSRRVGFKELVNEALRRGLRQMGAPTKRSARYCTTSVELGRCLVGSIDDVAEVLAVADGEGLE